MCPLWDADQAVNGWAQDSWVSVLADESEGDFWWKETVWRKPLPAP
jgi:hypothetical protein